ncbi:MULTISPECIES: hypothetical protein [Nostocales]|uniref:Type II secretion system protein GspG C-terminal domain-containing protein n=3 Tax=Nostocales TaxID=1161 RepID=A0A0C1R2N6_9CYAN|nr:hypothetical protein [Tolypothrix bouteillei]KAF3885980.1 hypothetical protein DA73_0400011240 [Tolypothrix bouteillei VB521301]
MLKSIISISLFYLLVACNTSTNEQRFQNCSYLKEKLGKIVLDFQKKHDRIPSSFEEAHKDTQVILPNRGDAFGNPLIYRKTGEKSFYFLSYGVNGKLENGQGDDLKVTYDKHWQTSCVELRSQF